MSAERSDVTNYLVERFNDDLDKVADNFERLAAEIRRYKIDMDRPHALSTGRCVWAASRVQTSVFNTLPNSGVAQLTTTAAEYDRILADEAGGES